MGGNRDCQDNIGMPSNEGMRLQPPPGVMEGARLEITCTELRWTGEDRLIGHFTVMDGSEREVDLVLIQTFFALLWQLFLKNTSKHKNNLIYIIKQEGLYQNKLTLSLASIHNCKMAYSNQGPQCIMPPARTPDTTEFKEFLISRVKGQLCMQWE